MNKRAFRFTISDDTAISIGHGEIVLAGKLEEIGTSDTADPDEIELQFSSNQMETLRELLANDVSR